VNRIVLIGDSIRMGYQEVVGSELDGLAEVWAPGDNGGNSANVLCHLDEWALSRPASVVHINCGLHDLKKQFDSAEAAIPVEQYEANVRQILERLVRASQGAVVFATTTPVNEMWHHENKGFDRIEADVTVYNEAAAAVAEGLAVPINDLFGVVAKAGRDRLLQDDGVHFTAEGYALLGKAVAKFVRRFL